MICVRLLPKNLSTRYLAEKSNHYGVESGGHAWLTGLPVAVNIFSQRCVMCHRGITGD